jgi:hypothetical protein
LINISSPSGINLVCLIKIEKMMKIQILALFWGVLMACSVAAQRLEVEPPTDNGGNYTFRISDLPPLKRSNTFQEDPFYNIFRIYGNGEYAPYIRPNRNVWENYNNPIHSCCNRERNCNTLNCTISSHTATYSYPSPRGLKYNHMALILSRKGTDPPPPVPVEGRITPPEPNPGRTFTPRERTIPDGKILYLTHSHGYLHAHTKSDSSRFGEKSVFIISYKADPCILNDSARIYLFYGRKKTGTRVGADYVRHQHFLNTDISPQYIPTYLPGASPVRWEKISTTQPIGPFANYEVFNLPPSYVSDVATAIGDTAEQRLFREVEYDTSSMLGPNEWSYAYAVLTTTSKIKNCVPSGASLPIGIPGYDSTSSTINGQHIIVTDEILLKSGEPDDPNKLTIQQICQDGTVKFRLEFCNDRLANTSASGAQVVFSILNDNFEWCSTPDSIRYPRHKTKKVDTYSSRRENTMLDCSAIGELIEDLAYYNCKTKTFKTKGILLREECGEIDMVLKFKNEKNVTEENLNYMLRALQANPVLEAKVWLCTNETPLSITNTQLSPEIIVPAEFGTPEPNVIEICQTTCKKCPKERFLARDRKELGSFRKPCIFSRSFWRFWGRKEK